MTASRAKDSSSITTAYNDGLGYAVADLPLPDSRGFEFGADCTLIPPCAAPPDLLPRGLAGLLAIPCRATPRATPRRAHYPAAPCPAAPAAPGLLTMYAIHAARRPAGPAPPCPVRPGQPLQPSPVINYPALRRNPAPLPPPQHFDSKLSTYSACLQILPSPCSYGDRGWRLGIRKAAVHSPKRDGRIKCWHCRIIPA